MSCRINLVCQENKVYWVCTNEVGTTIKNPLSQECCWKHNCKGRRSINQAEIDALVVPTLRAPVRVCAYRECANRVDNDKAKYCCKDCSNKEWWRRKLEANGSKPREKRKKCAYCPNDVPKDRFKFCSKLCERQDNARRKRQKRALEKLKRPRQ